MKHVHVERCDSTQDVLKEQLSKDPDGEYLVSCEMQSAGRGRGSNKWLDSDGTICFSMTLTPHIKTSFTALELTLLVAKFFEVSGHPTKIKWPNDLLNKNEKKCAGVLIQSSGSRYLAGIGINLFSTSEIFGGIHDEAIKFDKSKWSHEVASYIRDHRYSSTAKLISDWNERCVHLNCRVRIIDDKFNYEGTFLGIGEDGEALLDGVENPLRIYNGSLILL